LEALTIPWFNLIPQLQPKTSVPGIGRFAIADREFGEQHRVPGLLDAIDHGDDNPERARIGGFLDIAHVRGRHTDERDATGLNDHLDQVLRFTPRQGAMLHLDPDKILPFAGSFRGLKVGLADRVAKHLLAGFQFSDHGVERERTRCNFLRVGGLTALGMGLSDRFQMQWAMAVKNGLKPRAKACILIWLDGGPTGFGFNAVELSPEPSTTSNLQYFSDDDYPAKIASTTLPLTSVSRKSRPA